MALSNDTNRNDYLGNGETTVFPFSYPILADADLVVTTRNDSNVETTLTLNTDYTVDGAGEAGGGLITLASGALTDGYALTIRRDMDIVQNADIRNAATYVAATHEDASDRAVMLDQEQQEEIERSIRFPETDAGSYARTRLPDAAHRANKLLVFDAAGNANVIGNGTGYFASSVGAWGQTWLDDLTSGAACLTLGFSSYMKGLLSSGTSAGQILTSLGVGSTGQSLFAASGASQALTVCGVHTDIQTLYGCANQAAAKAYLGIHPPTMTLLAANAIAENLLITPVDVLIASGTVVHSGNAIIYCNFRMDDLRPLTDLSLSFYINGVGPYGERRIVAEGTASNFYALEMRYVPTAPLSPGDSVALYGRTTIDVLGFYYYMYSLSIR